MNDFLKVLLGLVLLSAIPLGCLALDVITREMIGLPSLDEEELANVIVRPDFDWDDIEIEKEI